MKKAFMILVMVFIMATLVACGSDKITSNNSTNEVVATPDSTTETQQNEKTVTNEAIESNNQTDTPTDEGLAAYAGAYSDGTNYLVIEGENITLNGRKCEVTRVETDHFKSGIPVYYFIYENNEISIYYDEVCGMGCSLEQPEGSWLTYETIDIANVPHFDVEDEQVADTDMEQQNNKQAVDQGEVTEENIENNGKQIWVTLGDIEITEMPIARSVLEDDGWTIETSEVTNICRTTKDNNVIGVVLSEDKTMITSMTICNDENSLDHTIEEDLLVLLFGTVPVLSASKEDVISIMDSEETGEYRDHSLSETNWGLEFGNPDKCIGFVAANKDSKYFMITLISK